VILVIALTQVAMDRYVIKDCAFAAMVTVIVIAVTLYGAFIFNRALNISTKLGSLISGEVLSACRHASPTTPDSAKPSN
jgi:hypothetical protein